MLVATKSLGRSGASPTPTVSLMAFTTHYIPLLLLACVVTGCVVVPLPDKGPELRKVGVPRVGEPESSIRGRFGEPQLLDSGNFLLYEWTRDRQFVLVPIIPSGLPGGGVVAQGRIRLLVALDEHRRVLRVHCSVVDAAQQTTAQLGCGDRPTDAVQRPSQGTVTGLPDNLWLTASLSPDARTAAVTDAKRGTWVADLERLAVIGKYDGAKGFGVGLPQVAFHRSGTRLAIAQANAPTVVIERAGQTFGAPRSLAETRFGTVAFPCCGDEPAGIIGLDGKQAAWLTDLDTRVRHTSGEEGRITFNERGVEVKRAAAPGPFRLIDLDGRAIERSPRAVFGGTGFPSAVLDSRPPQMASGSTSFGFSPDGRLLARSTCTHVEVWHSDTLADASTTVGTLAAGPAQVFSKPLRDESTVSLPMPYDCPGGAIAFHPGSNLLAVADADEVHLWQIDSGAHLASLRTGERSPIVALAFAPDDVLTAVAMSTRGPLVVLRWQTDLAPASATTPAE